MATIIDALVMTLGLDASDYQKNSQKVKKENQSFTEEQKKQLDKVEKQAKQALSAISNVQKGILGLFTAVAGATGVGQFLTQVNQAEAALGRLSSYTGQSTEELHKWSNMAAIVGGSAEDMQAGVSNLQQQLTDLKYKGEMGSTVTFLAQMGVAVADTNGEMRKQSDIMLDLSDRAKNMKKEDFYNLASSSGMTDSQIDLIMKGRTELEKMMIAQEENALVTKEQAEEARKLQAEWEMMKQSMFSAGVRILHDLMPIIQLIAEGLREIFNFLQKHRGIIYGFFIGLAAAMLPVLLTATALVGQFLLLASPIIAVSLAIGLLIDDFLTWQEGGESLFGTFYDWFDKLIDKVTGFGDLLKAIFTGDWAKVSEIIARKIQTVVEEAPKSIKDAHQAAVGVATDMIENAANFFSGDKPKEATPADSKGLANFAQNAEIPSVKTVANKMTESIKDGLSAVGSILIGTAHAADTVQQGMQSSTVIGTQGNIKKLVKTVGTTRVYEMEDGSVETRKGGSVSWRNNNQGNMKFEFKGSADKSVKSKRSREQALLDAQKRYKGVVDLDQWGNAIFVNEKAGREAKAKLLTSTHKDRSVSEMLRKYALKDYSGTPNYAAYEKAIYDTAKQKGFDIQNKRIGTMSKDELDALIEGMKKHEGFKKGDVQIQKSTTSSDSIAGARAQAAIGELGHKTSSSSIETSIGEVNIYTAATDSHGIAKEVGSAIDNALKFNTYAFDTGMT